MNDLRIPVGILVVIVAALVAWFFLSRPVPTAQLPQTTSVATTTSTTQVVEQTPTQGPPPSDPATVAANVVGTWQSTDDPNYRVSITAAGKWTDTYAGSDASSASQTGTYKLFTSVAPDKAFTGVLVPGVVYVKVSEGDTVSYFSVLQADGTQLQLSYLDRGNTLSFVKVQ